jgi:hypothetical protein
MVWTVFVPDKLSKSPRSLNSSNPLTSKLNHDSTPLTQPREGKSWLDVEKYQLYVEIATDVLQIQNKDQLKALKNFLNTLPSPTDIEAVLTEAVNQLAEIDREAYDWVLQHPDDLMPELDLVSLAQHLVMSTLNQQGLIPQQDFDFTAEGKLKINAAAEMALFLNCSEPEYLLIQEVFKDRVQLNDQNN